MKKDYSKIPLEKWPIRRLNKFYEEMLRVSAEIRYEVTVRENIRIAFGIERKLE